MKSGEKMDVEGKKGRREERQGKEVRMGKAEKDEGRGKLVESGGTQESVLRSQ